MNKIYSLKYSAATGGLIAVSELAKRVSGKTNRKLVATMLSLTVAGTVNTANIDISNVCSCPLISRQGLYLKLTLPADVDILAESDNPTHCADGFHCNVRSPLQDYAMPFLHSVSA